MSLIRRIGTAMGLAKVVPRAVVHETPPRETSAPAALLDEEFRRQLASLKVASRRLAKGRARGERRAKQVGAGMSFADYRNYVPGDDERFIDWHVYQRTGRLVVRLFEQEQDLFVHVLLDVSSSMGTGRGEKLAAGKRLAAALAYLSLTGLDRVSVQTFAGGVLRGTPPLRGQGQLDRLLHVLQEASSDGSTDLLEAARQVVARQKRRGVIYVISDFYAREGITEALDRLRYARFEPMAICVSSPFDHGAGVLGDVELEDVETGERRRVNLSRALTDAATRAQAAHVADLAGYCAEKQIPFVHVPADVGLSDAVVRVLRAGGMVA